MLMLAQTLIDLLQTRNASSYVLLVCATEDKKHSFIPLQLDIHLFSSISKTKIGSAISYYATSELALLLY